ncbi:MAG TPA: hypothetical protein VN641_22440 [Urbifossiella sp.]|nr:hypothetical protein [Urbifossiella sp.]
MLRMAYEPPLGIEFEIIEDDKKVRVLRVWSLCCQGCGKAVSASSYPLH